MGAKIRQRRPSRTELAPRYGDELDSKPGSKLAHEPGESDRLINVAIQQLERLKRGKPSAA